MELIELIQNSAFATFIRESPSLLGYTAVLSLHAMGLAVVVGINGAIALRLLGVAPEIPLAPLVKLFPVMYIGFWVNALSGLALLSANASSMLVNIMFYIKLAFIALALLALRLMRNRIFGDIALKDSVATARQAQLLAIWCLACWGGAIISGRLTAYPYFVRSWFGI